MDDVSFKYCGIDPGKLRKSVIETLSSRKKDVLISEFLYFYIAPLGSKIMCVRGKNKNNLHYVIWPNGTIVDLSEESQEGIDWGKSQPIKVSKVPGSDVKRLAEFMGFSDDDLDLEEEE